MTSPYILCKVKKLKVKSDDLQQITECFFVRQVEMIDEFIHPETERVSHCYRITYRSMEKTFRDEEVNEIQDLLRDQLRVKLQVKLRG